MSVSTEFNFRFTHSCDLTCTVGAGFTPKNLENGEIDTFGSDY